MRGVPFRYLGAGKLAETTIQIAPAREEKSLFCFVKSFCEKKEKTKESKREFICSIRSEVHGLQRFYALRKHCGNGRRGDSSARLFTPPVWQPQTEGELGLPKDFWNEKSQIDIT